MARNSKQTVLFRASARVFAGGGAANAKRDLQNLLEDVQAE